MIPWGNKSQLQVRVGIRNNSHGQAVNSTVLGRVRGQQQKEGGKSTPGRRLADATGALRKD